MKLVIMAAILAAMTTACASTPDRVAPVVPAGAEYINNGKSSRLVAKMDDVDDYTLDNATSSAPLRKEAVRKKQKRKSR